MRELNIEGRINLLFEYFERTAAGVLGNSNFLDERGVFGVKVNFSVSFLKILIGLFATALAVCNKAVRFFGVRNPNISFPSIPLLSNNSTNKKKKY